MRPIPSLILIEFNELCPMLMARFIKDGHLPHFQRLYEQSEVFTTDAEEEGENLNPWVQWVTVHSGLGASEHGVKTLSEGPLLKQPAIWDLVSNAGHRVWVCGSMNPRWDHATKGFLLPDPWSEGIGAQPVGEFDAYHRYVRSAVQEHTNETATGKGGPGAFLWFLLRHGLTARTCWAAFKQLVGERVWNTRWKRATIMDQFQWDVFAHYYHKHRPQLSTFFLNSTAHLQHCFWRHMEPGKFQCPAAEKEQRELQHAILFGYQKMDKLIQRFMRIAGDDTILVLCTALSQQPYLDHEAAGGRHYYRVRDERVLVEHLAISQRFTYEPLMAEQFYLRFESETDAQDAECRLAAYHVKNDAVFKDNRTRLFHTVRKGKAILAQCRCTTTVPQEAVITEEPSNRQILFSDVFYVLGTVKSGRHHPDGILWIRNLNRGHVVHGEKASLKAVAPTILTLLNVPVPSYMKTDALIANCARQELQAGVLAANDTSIV